MSLTVAKLTDDGYKRQLDYLAASGIELTSQIVLDCLAHLTEETIEARQCLPRRYWRTDEQADYDELARELADVVIWATAIAGMVGLTGDEFSLVIQSKLEYNKKRANHRHGN